MSGLSMTRAASEDDQRGKHVPATFGGNADALAGGVGLLPESDDLRVSVPGGRIAFICASSFVLGMLAFVLPLGGDFGFEVKEPTCVGYLLWNGYYLTLSGAAVTLFISTGVPGISLFWLIANILLTTAGGVYSKWVNATSPKSPNWNMSVAAYFFIGLLILTSVHTWKPSALQACSARSTLYASFATLPLRARLRIATFTWLHLGVLESMYTFCVLLSSLFVQVGGQKQVFVYILFKMFFWLMKPLAHTLARSVEKLELDLGLRLAYCSSFVVNTFYFVFYRTLFLEAKGPGPFLQSALVHATSELFAFVVRAMPSWFRLEHHWRSKTSRYLYYSHSNADVHYAYELTTTRRSVEYGNRFLLTVMTLLILIAYLSFDRFGYNQGTFRDYDGGWDGNRSHNLYQKIMWYLGVMMCMEFLLHALIRLLIRRIVGNSFLAPWYAFLRQSRLHSWWMVLWLSHIISDTALAKVVSHKHNGDPLC